jgi:hypothetical protein
LLEEASVSVFEARKKVESLEKSHRLVTERIDLLSTECGRVTQEIQRLEVMVMGIQQRMGAFDVLPEVAAIVHSKGFTVFEKGFSGLLGRLDEALVVLAANPEWLDGPSFAWKLEQLLLECLTLIKRHFGQMVRSTALQVLAKEQQQQQQQQQSSNTTTTSSTSSSSSTSIVLGEGMEVSALYTRFRTIASPLKSLISEVESRAGRSKDCGAVLGDCYQTYYDTRLMLLSAPLSATLTALEESHGLGAAGGAAAAAGAGEAGSEALLRFARASCSHLMTLLTLEGQLLGQFFATAHDNLSLGSLAAALGEAVYERTRPHIIKLGDLDSLCDLAVLFKSELIPEALRRPGASAEDPLPAVLGRMLQDTQERVIFRTQAFLQDEIRGFSPRPEHLSYPELVSSAGQEQAAAAGDESEVVEAGEEVAGDAGDVNASLSVLTRTPASRADVALSNVYNAWYPTLARTLSVLSQLYLVIDQSVFEGLAQDAVQLCTESLVSAAAGVERHNKARRKLNLEPAGAVVLDAEPQLHSQLFLAKHLLILREQITPFEISFARTTLHLDFSQLYAVLGNIARLFSVSGLKDLLSSVAPSLSQVSEDSKKGLDQQLRACCESFIVTATRSVAGSMLTVVEKAAAGGKPTALECRRAVDEAAAGQARLWARVREAVALYLVNSATRMVLLRPVRHNVVLAVEGFFNLIAANFDIVEQSDISSVTKDELLKDLSL